LAGYIVAYAGSLRFVYTAGDVKILKTFAVKALTMVPQKTSSLGQARIE